MAERERTDTESFEFDFFDDSPTTETTTRGEPRPPLRRRRLPTRPPTGNTPLLRLAGLIVGAIALVVFLVLWISGCMEDRQAGQYRSYMESVQTVGAESERIGRDLNQLVFAAGIQVEDLQGQLDGLRGRQMQTVRQAEGLDAPGTLREQHESLIEAMQLRVSGLNGLARALATVAEAAGAEAAATDLARQSHRLLASDVMYDDFFRDPAKEVMDERGVTDVAVPESDFVTNDEFASPASWELIVQRLTRPAAAGGLHGNRIAGVRALPGGEELSRTDENTVRVSDRLAFEVSVENSGDAQETQVNVTLTIQQSPEPIRQEATIDAINPGDTKTVVFRDLGAVDFGPQVVVRVSVEPVPGEENTDNNTAEYPMIFTLG